MGRWSACWRACKRSVRGGPRRYSGRGRAEHCRSVRADPEGTAGQVSEPDRGTCLARAAGRAASGRVHGGARSVCGGCVRGPRRPRCRASRPGQAMQAQMDFGVYDIDFTREGRRRVYLFSYLLGYSRRQYLRLVESMDLLTTLREHVQAFHHLGGVARVCLYDNFKAVVLRRDADGPLYNPRFLAFATHYGFKPQACQVRRPQTKGKVERKFCYVETSLLNGRTFDTLEHLNEVTAGWLQSVADVRSLRDFKESPRERHQREQPHLLPLPGCDFDTALVIYRHVNVEGFLAYRSNFYSVPWSYIGQVLPVRVTADEVIIYSIGLDEIARHRLVPSTTTGTRHVDKSHHPADDPGQRTVLLQQRFGRAGTDRDAVPRRFARQAGPGQAASPAVTGAGGALPA